MHDQRPRSSKQASEPLVPCSVTLLAPSVCSLPSLLLKQTCGLQAKQETLCLFPLSLFLPPSLHLPLFLLLSLTSLKLPPLGLCFGSLCEKPDTEPLFVFGVCLCPVLR